MQRDRQQQQQNAGYEERYEERKRYEDYSGGSSRLGRDYKEKWAAPYASDRPRFEYGSRSRTPPPPPTAFESKADDRHAMAGLIFMCNKKTQRRCLAYEVLGMPMAKRRLADQVTPGMPLFLFEFESRDLYGVFEATSHVGVDLEPKAFLEAEIDFPLQVRFRVMHKCHPLRESEYKDAISENYFQTNRFKFDLTRDQVSRLFRLFVPVESNGSRSTRYPYLTGPSSHDNAGADYRGLTTSSRGYRSDDYRKDEHWKKDPEEPLPKPSYLDGHSSNLDYSLHKEPAAYVPDYKLGRYYDTPKLGTHRYETDTWCSSYDYNTVVESLQAAAATSSVHQSGVSPATYVPSKYDLVSGYSVGRPDTVALPTEAARFWKADDSVLPQMSAAEQYMKAAMYSRPALPVYSEVGNGERVDPIDDSTYRMASKKPMLPEVDYLSGQASAAAVGGLATLPVTHVQATAGDYRAFGSNPRKLYYGYPDDGLSAAAKQPGRYSIPDPLPPDSSYVSGISMLDTTKERYRREPSSPRAAVLPDARYVPAVRHYEREGGYGSMRAEDGRHYEVQHPPPRHMYRRSSPETYARLSPDRGARKASVWERVSGLTPVSKTPKTNGNYSNHYKRRREYSPAGFGDDFEDLPKAEIEQDDSFVVDFKRRNKSNDNGDTSQQDETKRRKKKIVRPA